MGYLIGQMWFCLLAAFLLGAFLYWLLFGRGLKARLVEQETDWTTRYQLLQNDYQKLDTKAKQSREDLAGKTLSLTQLEGKYGKAQSELEGSMATFASLQTEHDSLREASAGLQTDVDGLKVNLASHEADLDAERRSVIELKDSRNALQARIDEHAETIAALNKAADQQRDALAALKAREAELESIIAQLRRDLDDASSESENQLQLIGSLKDEQISNTRQLDEVNSSLQLLNTEKQSLFGELETDRNALGSLRGDLGGAQARVAELEANIKDRERELADREAASRALQDKSRNAEERLSGLEAKLAAAERDLGHATQAVSDQQRKAETTSSQLKSQIAELQKKLSGFEGDLAAARKAADAAGADSKKHRSTIDELERRLSDCRSARDALEAKLKKATAKPKMPAYGLKAPMGRADDLKRVKGIGPKLEGILHGLGIFHFRQIARFTQADVTWVTGHMAEFKGRIERDDWIRQASALHQNDYNEKA